MKKFIFIFCIVMILLVGCKAPHIHEYIEGICECGEVDINYQKHVHKYIEGVCECGEKDPNYKKHEHNYIEGVCECGEVNPNFQKHEHNYIEGICECGEKDPNYAPSHECIYFENAYCYECGSVYDKHVYIDGICKCGKKENDDYTPLKDMLTNTYETYSFSEYFEKACSIWLYRNYYSNTFRYTENNEFISYFCEIMDLEFINVEDAYSENIKSFSYFSHDDYDFHVYLDDSFDKELFLIIYTNGVVTFRSNFFDGIYVSLENIDFPDLVKNCYIYREGWE